MAYTTVADVTARWARTPTDEEVALILVRLEDCERMIRRRIPTLDAKISSGAIADDDLKQVVADAVLRLVRNPDGYLSETDGSYTYMLRQDMATGKLEIFPEEWEILGVTKSRISFLIPTPVMPT